MDYWGLFADALKKWWQHKYLWLIGLVGTILSGSSINTNFNLNSTTNSSSQLGQTFNGLNALSVLLVILLVIIGLIVLLVGFYLSLRATSGLVQATPKLDAGETLSFKKVWGLGKSHVGNLFAQYAILFLPLIILIILMIWGAVMLGLVSASRGIAAGNGSGAGVIAIVGIGGLLCCALVLYGIFVSIVYNFSVRIAILEGKNAWQSIKMAATFTIDHIGDLAVFWLLSLLVGFASSVILTPVVIVLTIIMTVPSILIVASSPLIGILAIAAGSLVLGLISSLITGPVSAFTNLYWTKVYLALKNK